MKPKKKQATLGQLIEIAKGMPRKRRRDFCKKIGIPYHLVAISKAENDELIKRRQPNMMRAYKVVGNNEK
jgi:hypothetical protein